MRSGLCGGVGKLTSLLYRSNLGDNTANIFELSRSKIQTKPTRNLGNHGCRSLSDIHSRAMTCVLQSSPFSGAGLRRHLIARLMPSRNPFNIKVEPNNTISSINARHPNNSPARSLMKLMTAYLVIRGTPCRNSGSIPEKLRLHGLEIDSISLQRLRGSSRNPSLGLLWGSRTFPFIFSPFTLLISLLRKGMTRTTKS